MGRKQTKNLDVKEEFEIKFWKDWLEADILERQELVRKLPIFKTCIKMKNNKLWKDAFDTMLNGYFEDLESAVYTKIRLEEEKNRKK